MLHTLLFILEIIGIILLILLGVLLLTIGLVLLVPVRYKGHVSAERDFKTAQVKMRIYWLFHCVSGTFVYENQKTSGRLRVFWKTFCMDDKDFKEAEEDVVETVADTVTETVEETVLNVEREEVNHSAANKEPEKVVNHSKNTGKKRKKQGFFQKLKYTIKNICDKIKEILRKKDAVLEFIKDETHLAAWQRCKSELLYLLRKLKPRKLKGRLKFGFEDPYHTGQALAGLSILYPIWANMINVEPDFENKVFQGDVKLQGRVQVVSLLAICVRLILDKNVRTTYKDFKKGKNNQ